MRPDYTISVYAERFFHGNSNFVPKRVENENEPALRNYITL